MENNSQPFYMYQIPMFSITVSTVLFVENGIIAVDLCDYIKFPTGLVKAGQESLHFAALRHVKEQIGIVLQKNLLIPVDFRSDPERSTYKNVVDLGFMVVIDKTPEEILKTHNNLKWFEIDMEKNKVVKETKFYMDHELLLERAIQMLVLMKD